MLKVVIDANVWISSLWSDGKPRRIRERFERGEFELFFAQELLDECRDVLARPKFDQWIDANQAAVVLDLIRSRATFVRLPAAREAISRDPSDDKYLLCAKIGSCDFLVSGDPDLLVVGTHGGTRIVKPAEFLAILEQQGNICESGQP
ncbi:MAG TPA: putative toxin-antitoxin system toxin component, PIN family [Planktothrix sp.]